MSKEPAGLSSVHKLAPKTRPIRSTADARNWIGSGFIPFFIADFGNAQYPLEQTDADITAMRIRNPYGASRIFHIQVLAASKRPFVTQRLQGAHEVPVRAGRKLGHDVLVGFLQINGRSRIIINR